LKIIRRLERWLGKISIVELYGELSATVLKKDGRIKNLGIVARRKVTTEFVNFLVDQLQVETAAIGDFKYHLSGTGTTAESNTDVLLVTPIGTTRTIGSQEEAANNIYKSVATISYTATYAVTEHGIFNEQYAAAQDDGILLDRSVFSAINVVNGDAIQFTYELTVNAET